MRPAFNWFCVLCSAADVLTHAAHIRAAQLTSRTSAVTATSRKRRKDEIKSEAWHTQGTLEPETLPRNDGSSSTLVASSVVSESETQDKTDPSLNGIGQRRFTVVQHPVSSDAVRNEPATPEDILETSQLENQPTAGAAELPVEVRWVSLMGINGLSSYYCFVRAILLNLSVI